MKTNLRKQKLKDVMDGIFEDVLQEKVKNVGNNFLNEQIKFKKPDIKVADDFVDQKPNNNGEHLETDGKVLNGLWMGGNKIAKWKNGKIIFNDVGSKAGDTIQKFIRNIAPKNWIKEATATEVEPKQVRENDFLNDRKKTEIVKYILKNSDSIAKEFKKMAGVKEKDFTPQTVNGYDSDDSLGYIADLIIEDGLEEEIIELM